MLNAWPSATWSMLPGRVALLGLAIVAVPRFAYAADGQPRPGDPAAGGLRTYKDQCARCHGKAGEGSEDYPRSLAGDRSVNQLAKLIAKTMPEDDPGLRHQATTPRPSPRISMTPSVPKTARERNRAKRVELTRPTVRQYRNVVADLIGSFQENGNWGDVRGLDGEYFKTRRMERRQPQDPAGRPRGPVRLQDR